MRFGICEDLRSSAGKSSTPDVVPYRGAKAIYALLFLRGRSPHGFTYFSGSVN